MNARNILFLTHVGDPGGAEYKMIDLCRCVRDRAEVLLFQHGSLETLLRSHDIRASVCKMPAATRALRKEGGVLSIVKALPGALAMLASVVRKARQFDMLVCFSQKSFVIACMAKPFARRPVIWFMNDILSTEHFSRALIKSVVLLSRWGANYVVLNSQASLNAWWAAGGRAHRVGVIYPGVSQEWVAAQLHDATRIDDYRKTYGADAWPLVGMFGRISPWKGQDVFLRALARLPQVQAVIVGEPLFSEQSYETYLRNLAQQLGIADRVRFVGHVDDVLALMAACDVVAHCSTVPEPFGLVIAEAMFAGTPVVASDAGGAREIVVPDETGQLTPLKDDAALAAAIRRYLDDPGWSQALKRRAKEHVERRFTAQAMTAGFLSVVEGL